LDYYLTKILNYRSLGALNYIRVWHDNTGKGASASWFLKYIIIRDLQTMEKSYFICQQWLAVEKEDGRVNYLFVFVKRIFSFVKFRLNVFYQLQVHYKNKNFHMFYQKKPIIVYQKVIFGFQFFLGLLQINLPVFNVVLVVLYYCLLLCFLIFSIMIKQQKRKQVKTLVVYHWVLFISLQSRFVSLL